jgi:hypothetical protein
VIGMTSQVSDVAISSKPIRRTAAAHGIISFVFNVALLSLMVNIAGRDLRASLQIECQEVESLRPTIEERSAHDDRVDTRSDVIDLTIAAARHRVLFVLGRRTRRPGRRPASAGGASRPICSRGRAGGGRRVRESDTVTDLLLHRVEASAERAAHLRVAEAATDVEAE